MLKPYVQSWVAKTRARWLWNKSVDLIYEILKGIGLNSRNQNAECRVWNADIE